MQIEKARVNGASTNNTESSVLFSLASLSSMATPQQPVAPSKPASKPPEDLFGIGALPSPVLAPVVAAPVVIAPVAPRGAGMRGWIAAACVVGAAILGGSYVAATTIAMGRGTGERVTVSARVGVSESESVGESESESETAIATTIATATPTAAEAPTPTRRHPITRPVVVTPVVPRTEAHPPSHPLTLEELVDRAAHPTADPLVAPAHTTHAAPAAPTTPSRDDVTSALRGVTPAVTACGTQQHGTALVRITVAHTGRVSGALVSGDLAGTPAGSCVAQAVRGASFPSFTQSTFVISYPFRI